VVAEEKAIVAERGHGDAYLSQVIQVLKDRGLGRREGGREGLSGDPEAGRHAGSEGPGQS
jgi:hypothetical protein